MLEFFASLKEKIACPKFPKSYLIRVYNELAFSNSNSVTNDLIFGIFCIDSLSIYINF